MSRHRPPVPVCLALAAVFAALGGAALPVRADAPLSPLVRPGRPAVDADPLERLRERLAEKLGAKRLPEDGNPNVLRVATPATAPAAPASAVRPRAARAPAAHAVDWGYDGEGGPQAWGRLRPDYELCASGRRQSPIDIRDGFALDLEPLQFDYRPAGFTVIDTGHTVQVDVAAGSALTLGGRRWELVQVHFHHPSEERIDGRAFDMVAHLVHRDAGGHLLVLAVLLERGSEQPQVQAVWNNLPLERGEAVPAAGTIDLAGLLPADRRYYTYMGSLTTPPCSEGVQWVVLQQPVQLSAPQIDLFARLYPMNARPLQQAAGRRIKQSR